MPRLKPFETALPTPKISAPKVSRSIFAITTLTCEFPISIPDIKYGRAMYKLVRPPLTFIKRYGPFGLT